MSNSTYAIGVGRLWITPTSNYLGQPIPLEKRKPIALGAIQDLNFSITADVKSVKGSESKMPLAQAQTAQELSGSFKYKDFSGESFSYLMFGQVMDDGQYATVLDTAGHVINNTHSVTVTPPDSGSFEKDLGVFFNATLVQLERVETSPATGQYSLDEDTATYTFATADESKKVNINYCYKASTQGKSLTIQNSPMGPTAYFRLDAVLNTADGEQIVVSILKCVASKYDIAAKMDDFTENSVDFKACQDEFGRTLIYGTPR